MKEQNFCLRWNDFRTNFVAEFENLREEENFIDVTIACSGKLIKAHKVVLSACSQFFKYILKEHPCKHPIIVMQEISYNHLKSLIDFMYIGETNVAEDDLHSFLQIADSLKIRGLMDASHQYKDNYGNITKELHSVGSTDLSIDDNKKAEIRTNNCSSADRSFNENNDATSENSSSDIFSNPANKEENRIYGYSSTSATTNSENQTNSDVPMEYSSDEDVKPEMAMSLLEIDAADSQLYSLTQSKPGTKLSKSESRNDDTESHSSQAVASDVIRYHSLDPRPCPSCNRLYSNMSNLRQHIRLIHKPESITCPLCSKLFKNKLYLKRHLISFHELPPSAIAELEKTKCNSYIQDYDRYGKRSLKQQATLFNNNNNNNNNSSSANDDIAGNSSEEISPTGNVFSYSSNFIVSSSIVRSVSEFKSHENNLSLFNSDYLPLTPLQPLDALTTAKLPDQDHNSLNRSTSSVSSNNNLSSNSEDTRLRNNYCKSSSSSVDVSSEMHNTNSLMPVTAATVCMQTTSFDNNNDVSNNENNTDDNNKNNDDNRVTQIL